MRMTPGRSVVPMLLVLDGPPAAQGGDWTTHGGNDWNQRYSTLRQIDTGNVAPLGDAVLAFGLPKARK